MAIISKFRPDREPYLSEIDEAQAAAYYEGHKETIHKEIEFYIDEQMIGPPNLNRKDPHAWNWQNWAWYCIAYEKIEYNK